MSLDILGQVSIAAPCEESWAGMTGGDRVRFCERCALHVYDLSALTREEAVELVTRTEGKMCARFFRREDGTMLTRDCPAGMTIRARRVALFGMFGSALAAIPAFAWIKAIFRGRQCGLDPAETRPVKAIEGWINPQPPYPLMGKIAIPIRTPAPAATPAPPHPKKNP